jgi:hypothetical protein
MRMLIALLVSGGLLAGAAGCTSSSRLDEQTWCANVAEVECRWIYSCCNLGERLAATGLNAHEESEPACREQLTASCLDEWAVPLASIAAGRLSFQIEPANTCLDTLRTTASQCPAVIDEADDCKQVVAGLVGMDGECAYDEECAGQSRCRRLGAGASGRCYDKSGQDGLCETTLDCQDGLFCYQGTMPQYVCVAIPTVGPGEACNGASLICDQGYFCDSGTDECVAQKASGESCTGLNQCQEGLICEYGGRCGAGLGAGQACSYTQLCGAGLYCDTTGATDQCAARKTVGSTCMSAEECDASLYCDSGNHCNPRKAPGDTCLTGNNSCQAWYACQPRGNCASRGDVGSECYSDDQCLERLRCNPDARVCEMEPIKLPAGSFCLQGTECESGQCVSGECIAYCIGER